MSASANTHRRRWHSNSKILKFDTLNYTQPNNPHFPFFKIQYFQRNIKVFDCSKIYHRNAVLEAVHSRICKWLDKHPKFVRVTLCIPQSLKCNNSQISACSKIVQRDSVSLEEGQCRMNRAHCVNPGQLRRNVTK